MVVSLLSSKRGPNTLDKKLRRKVGVVCVCVCVAAETKLFWGLSDKKLSIQ